MSSVLFSGAVVLLLWSYLWPAQPACAQAPSVSLPALRGYPGTQLGDVLKNNGYSEVPLTVGKTGLLEVTIRFNGEPLLFLVDTGANDSVVDETVARRLNLPLQKSRVKMVGIGGITAPADKAVVQLFTVGDVSGRLEAFVGDLSHVNAARRRGGEQPYAGLLGGNVLAPCAAVIDYSTRKLYLRNPGPR
jgi:hypothetical protein